MKILPLKIQHFGQGEQVEHWGEFGKEHQGFH